MADAGEVHDGLPGWLFAAGRAACGYGFRELGEAASVATNWLQKIETMPAIPLRHARGRGATGIDPSSLARLLTVFERAGLELRGPTRGRPAMLICNDPAALDAIRALNGKSPRERLGSSD